jgi:hypothetical protein
MRSNSDKSILRGIELIRDYLRDGRIHPRLSAWHLMKARRILGVDGSIIDGWLMRHTWSQHLREIGLDAETLEIVDPFRWKVARELIDDPTFKKTFPLAEFRRRLACARLAEHRSQLEYAPAEEPSERSVALGKLGIELD